MGPFLLDANVLIALAWPTHFAHARTARWFASHAELGWATCPFTQAAFVRILSNPAFSSNALMPRDAMRLLEANLEHPKHQFWGDSISLDEATRTLQPRLTGHRQITDAYLVGLALHHKGRLATLDRGIPGLVTGAQTAVVEVIP